ncbi:ABC transporter ATP-binding protein [Gorillibacterium sp. sgz500922]|uniref:ABC transporter ATP-binding protein n=1 Tax=Gorillibacterium sp. sgz500922 TaxID=3446694 RepID=UPI003F66D1B7
MTQERQDRHLLELEALSLAFRDRGREERVLDSIGLHVDRREFVSILGPSGSGKSTLFHLIGGLLKPDSGRVLLNGEDIAGQVGRISYMPQQPALLPWRTVRDNVILARELKGGKRKAELRAEAERLLDRAGLAGYAGSYPNLLSGGMMQRASFVRALLSPQELLALDEPFGALDELTRLDMQRWLLDIWEEEKRSVLFITHSIDEAILLSDRIYLFSAKPARVVEEIAVPFARPRREELPLTPEFVELKRDIYLRMKADQGRDSDV